MALPITVIATILNTSTARAANYPELISIGENGQHGDGFARGAAISDDGRYVLFESSASNLTSNQSVFNSGRVSAFIRDRQAGVTKLVSVNSQNVEQNGQLNGTAISGNGRYVFFNEDDATNMSIDPAYLNPGYGYNYTFRHDIITGETILASVGNDNNPYIARSRYISTPSYDGNRLVFNGILRDISQGTNYEIPDKYILAVSSDGNTVAYTGKADGFSHGNTITVRDLTTNQDTVVLTTTEAESFYTFFSRNGNHIFFSTRDLNVIQNQPNLCPYVTCMYRYDLTTDTTKILTATIGGQFTYLANIEPGFVSGDGSKIALKEGYYDQGTSYEQKLVDGTGLQMQNIDTGAHHLVGYAENGQIPSLPPAPYSDYGSHYGISADASEVVFMSRAPEFGAVPNCTVDTEGTMTQEICAEVFVTDTVSRASDTDAPLLGTVSWSTNPKTVNSLSTLTIPAIDEAGGSGVAGGEYFLGDSDPGQGNGASMNWGGTNLTSTFGTDFPTGVYRVNIRAKDNAGNWGAVTTDYLVVYDPNGLRMTGRRTIVPSLANGDVLPGLIAGNQTDKAKFAFNIKYNNQGQIHQNSDMQLTYSTGTRCNNPNKAENCHELSLNTTSIAWLTTQGTNNSTGIFQGVATLVIDGVTAIVQFRVTGVDGERLSPTANDTFQIKVYAEGANLNTDAPLYQINAADIARGNVKIL